MKNFIIADYQIPRDFEGEMTATGVIILSLSKDGAEGLRTMVRRAHPDTRFLICHG